MDEPIVLAHRVRVYSAGVWKTAGAATALVTSIGLMALTLDASKAVGVAAMLAAVMLFVGAFWSVRTESPICSPPASSGDCRARR